MIVGDELVFLGSRNIEDRFLIQDEKSSYDWDLLVYSEKRVPRDAITQLEEYFDDIYENGGRNRTLDQATLFAKESVRIHTPYLIADGRIYRVLREVSAHARTTIFPNSPYTNANGIGAGDFIAQQRRIERLGAEVLLSSKDRLYHGKVFTVDDLVGIGRLGHAIAVHRH